jgi:hypothetical protein
MPVPAKQMLAEQARAIRDTEMADIVALDRNDIERAVQRAREALHMEQDFWN